MSAERLSSQYCKGELPGTLRSAVMLLLWLTPLVLVVQSDKLGAEIRQSNDSMLKESFIVREVVPKTDIYILERGVERVGACNLNGPLDVVVVVLWIAFDLTRDCR